MFTMFVNESFGVICFIFQVLFTTVTADYQCVCNYNVELTVHLKPSSGSQAIGFIYEFACKPLYGRFDKHAIFLPIQFEHKVGYVQQNNNIQIQVCTGTIPADDLVTLTTDAAHHHTTSSVMTKSSTKSSNRTGITYTQTKTTASLRNTSATTSAIASGVTHVGASVTSSVTMPAATNVTTSATTSTTASASASWIRSTATTLTTSAATSLTTTVPTSVTKSRIINVTSKPPCPSNWVIHGTSCYLFQTHHRKEWNDANKDCGTLHAHLAIIETADKDQFIREQCSHRVNTKNHEDSETGVWLGGTDHDNEGTWEWTDLVAGSNQPVKSYTNWYKHEPDSGDGDHDEDCMCMIGNTGFQWHDYKCSKDMFYVCERKAHISHVTPTAMQTQNPLIPSTSGNCPAGWIWNQGSCYFFNTADRSTWSRADSFCSAHQAHLAIIETADEDRFIVQEASHRINLHAAHAIYTGIWLAGTDDDNEGHWEWKEGFSYRPIHGYTNWHHGEPDSGAGEHDEDCMCLVGKYAFEWQDYKCDSHMYFICEKPVYVCNSHYCSL